MLAATVGHSGYVSGQTTTTNVLFLMVDDLRPQIQALLDPDEPPFLHPPMITPNLDSLASKSLVLRNAHVQLAVCSPSRASALTGRRPDTTHVYDLETYWRTAGGNFTTIPQYFKENGYESVGIGKIFHSGQAASGGDDPLSWTQDYYRPPNQGTWNSKNSSWQAVSADRIEQEGSLPDQQIRDRAIESLRLLNSGEKPFFLAVGFYKPHLPFLFPEEYLSLYDESDISLPNNPYAPVDMPDEAWSKYGEIREYHDIAALNATGEINTTLPDDVTIGLRRAYAASISYVDDLVGDVLEELASLGLASNTIVVFLSDHGWQLGKSQVG